MRNNSYTEKDISVLSDKEHVRKRLPVYAGSTASRSFRIPMFTGSKLTIKEIEFIPAVYKCVNEVIDNSIDEFAQIDIPAKQLKIKANPLLGTYTISDNGRGVPIGKHSTGKHTPEVVFGSLRSGRNFNDNDKEAGVIGVNGMGASITCFCSTEFRVDIQRDGKRYQQVFADGAAKVLKPSIRKTTSPTTGTEISFQLDYTVFDDPALPDELMKNRAMEIALTNPGVTASYNGEKFKYRRGFEDVISKLSKEYFKFECDGIEFFVILDAHSGPSEEIFTWVNSSMLFDGGICNTQFLNAFSERAIQHLSTAAKKQKTEIIKKDICPDLLIIGNLSLTNPEYDTQSKTRLTGPNLRKEITEMVDKHWKSFSRKNKDWLNTILERAMVRHHGKANTKALKEHEKNIRHKKVPGLVDATSSNRSLCQLLITEGDSAARMITDAREPTTTGSLPLRGKINNVFGSTVAQVLKMGKVSDLLAAIGLQPGVKVVRSNLNYGKIVIATDADVDGGDIFTLLVNLFYMYWPELFDENYEPIVHRLVAPNVCAIKGNKRVHFTTRKDYEKVKEKYKGWTIKYYKGLGSMSKQDWEMILSGKTDTLIPIIDDGKMADTLRLLFGPDADERKEWLQT